MAELLNGWKRTSYCAELSAAHIGKDVLLMGWVATWRNLGQLIFIGLRDRTGVVQLVFESTRNSQEVFNKAETLRSEYVVAIKGRVERRAEELINPNMKTGDIEVLVDDIKILNSAETPPIYITDDLDCEERIRLKYRYLDLRRNRMQQIMMMRSRITGIARNYFAENGFIDIETPMLCKSTPEGARDYLVPSRVHHGKFYALPQSPQLFKQLLMLSGYDRYFQIAKCFRDEDLRADRQPEFTQIDLEMSFVDEDDVMSVNEGFIKRLLKETLDVDVQLPLKRIPYREAMERFGSDKPDTRFGLELVDISDAIGECEFGVFSSAIKGGGSVRLINAKGAAERLTRRNIDELTNLVKTYRAKGLAWMSMKHEGMQCSFAKFLSKTELDAIHARSGAEEGDLIFFVADVDNEIVFAALGALRLELAKRLDLIPENTYDLLWVTDFPMFEWSEDDGRFVAKHHPFTSPKDEDVELLESNPAQVRAKAYDMVLNGNEIGGGSIRIHSSQLQERVFRSIGFTHEQAWERFGFLMEAFKYGTPPHGGLAYGLDRLCMIICGTNNIRDVIAFPKVQTASCLMTGCPEVVDDIQLKDLSIAVMDAADE